MKKGEGAIKKKGLTKRRKTNTKKKNDWAIHT